MSGGSEQNGGPLGRPRAAAFEQVFAQVRDVEGWLSPGQAQRLWSCARTVPAGGRIVEIGSFRGRSTVVLASAAESQVELVAVDPHAGNDRGPREIEPDSELGDRDIDAFRANLQRTGVKERVRHVRVPSDQALDEVGGAIDLLYVDGAHRFRPASEDIVHYGARVGEGGTMLIHDAFNAIGVMLAQLRLLLLSRRWRYIGRTGSLAEYRRENLTPAARRHSALLQLAGLPYFVRNLVVKVLLVAHLRPLTVLLGHRSGDWPY